MHNELGYQAKTHEISEKLFFENQKNNKDMLIEKEMTSSLSM